jgi:hypothetical protein
MPIRSSCSTNRTFPAMGDMFLSQESDAVAAQRACYKDRWFLTRPTWVAVILVLTTVGSAWGTAGGIGRLRARGNQRSSGLVLEIDTRWVDSQGYRPVKIRLLPIGGRSSQDRTVQVRLEPRSWRGNLKTAVTATLRLQQGSSGVEQVVPTLWATGNGDWMGVTTKEGGRVLPDLSSRSFAPQNTTTSPRLGDSLPAVLVIDRDVPPRGQQSLLNRSGQTAEAVSPQTHSLPDLSNLSLWLASNDQESQTWKTVSNKTLDDERRLRLIATNPSMDILPPAEIPENWINLSSLDMILVSLDDLKATTRQHPQARRAIWDWVAVGGTLVVYDAGSQLSRLGELDAALASSDPNTDVAESDAWRRPNPKLYGKPVQTRYLVSPNRPMDVTVVEIDTGVVVSTAEDAAGNDSVQQSNSVPDPPPFQFRPAALGLVIALDSEAEFPLPPAEWKWILNTIEHDRWNWVQRHGISLNTENLDFWNLLIPGVGSTPVGGFLILITVSLLLLGPVNYFVLRRRRRPYLLLLTVPVGAALITLAIVAYAILADGLGVKLRVRSYTYLDQATRQVTSWGRQTYYASLIPSEGLSFPNDTVIYCVLENEAGFDNDNQYREMSWQGDSLQLTRNVLQPRVPSQFLVLRSATSDARLRIRVSDDSNEDWQVANQLQTSIISLLVWDSKGNLRWAEQVPAGSDEQLAAIAVGEAERRLRKLFDANHPALPIDFDPAQYRSAFSIFRFGFFADSSWTRPEQQSGILEQQLKTVITPSHWNSHRGYVAVVETSPEMPIGIDSAEQIGSFHVIEGRW